MNLALEDRLQIYPMLQSFQVCDGQLLDIRKLMRMRGYLDRSSFLDLLNDFEDALRVRLEKLSSLPESAAVFSICHDILNISGTLGMCELMSASERLQEFARSNTSEIDCSRGDVLTAGKRALEALQSYKVALGS